MKEKGINDSKLLKLIDEQKMSQSDAARELGVTRQAVNYRLRQLRGRTTYAVAAAKVGAVVDSKLDVVEQLKGINHKANKLLDQVEDDAAMSVKLMSEIRGQLRLMMDVYEMLFSLEGAAQFQQAVLETLEEVDPELRKRAISKLGEKSALRSALRFK